MTYSALKNHVQLPQIIDLFTTGPASILGIKQAAIKENESANLCVFDPDAEVLVQAKTPLERKAKGKIIACISGKHTYLSNDQKRKD